MTHDLASWLRACATNEPSNDDAAKLWGAADLIESLRADLAEQKAAHGDCIKRNIALTGENAALRAEKDEIRKVTIEEAATIAYVEAVKHCSARDGKMLIGHPVGQAIAAAIRQKAGIQTTDDMPEGGRHAD